MARPKLNIMSLQQEDGRFIDYDINDAATTSKVDNIINGTTTVPKAKNAENAENADIATSANSAKKISYTKIEVETSINNMKTIGSYRCSYPKTDLLTDVPDFLKNIDFYKIDIIDKGIGNKDILQIITTPSCIGIRATGNNATRWYNWYEMATTNKIFGDFKDFTGNDLNDFNIKGGNYRVLKNVSNEPFNKNYNLTIERYDGGNAQFQIAKHIFSGKIKIRSYSANGWTAWQEIATTESTVKNATRAKFDTKGYYIEGIRGKAFNVATDNFDLNTLNLEQGVYVCMFTNIYDSWVNKSFGILLKFNFTSGSQFQYKALLEERNTITVSTKGIVSGTIGSIKLINLGYDAIPTDVQTLDTFNYGIKG